MANFGIQAQRFGLKKESVRGTAETSPDKWYPVRGIAELNFSLQHLEDMGIRGSKAKYPSIAGIKVGEGKVPLHFDPQILGEFYYSLLGTVASAEDSEITISNSNNKLNFNIGAGELTATVANASYPIGLSQATVGSLCKAIYDAIVAAEATGTYTVSYSRTTKLFTITRSAGTFQLLASTGTDVANGIWSTIGFAATNRTGALTYEGTVQIEYSFSHTFTETSGIQPPAYTFFLDRSMNVLKYNRGCVKALSFKSSVDGLVEVEAEVLFENEASGSIGSPSFPTQRYQSFQHVDFKIAGTSNTNVKEWDLKIDNGAKALRTLNLAQTLKDIIAPDKINVTGSFTIYFEDTTERDKFIANTSVAIRMLSQGDVIYGSTKWKNDLVLYGCKYTAFPYGEDEGLLAAKATFEAFYSTSDSKTLQIVTTNQDVSY
jgi:hypothetical protein